MIAMVSAVSKDNLPESSNHCSLSIHYTFNIGLLELLLEVGTKSKEAFLAWRDI
jgi:hypothetical protein